MKALFLIPARGGSKGIRHKNVKPLCGKPLIQYSIDIARRLAEDDDICVSTDDQGIINCVKKLGLSVPFKRPAVYATDSATTSDVISHALEYYEKKGVFYEIVVLLQPTSPLRTVENVKGCIKMYRPTFDMVATVRKTSVSSVLCKESKDGYLKNLIGGNTVRRQDAEELYEYNGAVYVINVKAFKKKKLEGFKKIKKFVMLDKNSIDIDEPIDWFFAEAIINNYNKIKE